nr:pp65/IE1 fusion protein [synthetic construct]
MESRGRRCPEMISVLGPISGHVLKAVFSRGDTPVLPHETRLLQTGIHVRVSQPSLILVSQYTPDSTPCHRGDNQLQVQHTYFTGSEVENVSVNVHNPTGRSICPSQEPMSIYVYALPLKMLNIPSINVHHYPSAAERKHRHLPVADAVIHASGKQMWQARLTVSGLAWTRQQNQWKEPDVYYTSAFVFPTKDVALRHVVCAHELVCSMENTRATKMQVIGDQYVKVYLESFCEDVPSGKLFMHVTLGSDVEEDLTMTRNPQPFMRPHERNGFTVLCPKNMIIKPGKISHIMLDVAFTSHEHFGLLCPKSIPGLSISGNLLMNGQQIFLEVQAIRETVELRQYDPVAALFFFDIDLLLQRGPQYSEHPTFTSQYRIQGKLEYRHTWDRHDEGAAQGDDDVWTSGSDSDEELVTTERKTPRVTGGGAMAGASTSAGRKRKSASSATACTSGVMTRGRLKAESTVAPEEDTDEDSDNEIHNPAVFTWPPWQAGILARNLVPMVATVQGQNLKYQEFFWDANDIYRIFAELEGVWQPAAQPKRRRHRQDALPGPCIASTPKKHRGESSAKRKMDPDNPDEGPSSKVPRPETPVTKATTFLQTMLRKEVNSQLSLGDPLFPELAEESLKTFEQVTEDCNENPEKDVLAELVKQIKVRVDMVRHRIKEHMLKKYTQTEEKFTGAFNMMGGCLQNALDILDKVHEPFEEMKCIGLTMQSMYENYIVPEDKREMWMACIKELHDVSKGAANKLGGALQAKARAKKDELRRKMMYMCYRNIEFFTKNSAFPKTTNGCSQAMAALQNLPQCSPDEIMAYAQKIFKILDEERDKVLTHIDHIFMDILTTCVETMCNEYKVTSDACMMTMYGGISLLSEFCRVLCCYVLEETSVMLAKRPLITKPEVISVMKRRIEEICMKVFAQYILGADPLRVCSPSVDDLRAVAEESDEEEAIVAYTLATAGVSSSDSLVSPPESPVPATIPLSSVIVAENSDQEESEQSDEEEEEGAQEEREDTVSVKSEPVSEIEEVAPEEEEDGAEEPTASGGKSTHPMVTRSKADQ